MTDKKIIIDGVDVSECRNYDRNQFWECKPFACHCYELPNCYFKQLKRKEQECNEYKDKVEYIHAFLRDPHNYGSFKPMWGSFLLHWLFNEDLGDFFPEEAYEMTDTIAEKEKQIINYKQALDEIEHQVRELFLGVENKDRPYCGNILDIINKAKDGE